MKFFDIRKFFALILISKMAVKMNLRITRKNHEPDPEIGTVRPGPADISGRNGPARSGPQKS